MAADSDGIDRRRNVRLDGRFSIRVLGMDAQPVARNGNISATGMYFEYGQDLGRPGTLHTLQLGVPGRPMVGGVLCVLVRVTTQQDLWSGARVSGVAVRFLPDERTGQALADLLAHVGAERESQRAPQIHQLVVHTSWAVPVGSRVHVELEAPSGEGRIRGEGTVESAEPDSSGGFQVLVRLPVDAAPATPWENVASSLNSLEDAFNKLADAQVQPAGASSEAVGPQPHLVGQLSRVRMQSLLGFCEMERTSGVLTLRRAGATASIYVREGRIVDVASEEYPFDARTLLVDVVQWTEGEFELSMQPVEREDRLGTPTTSLLLDIAREMDERTRPEVDPADAWLEEGP